MSSRSLPSRVAPSTRARSTGRSDLEDAEGSTTRITSSPRKPLSQNARPQPLPRPSRDRFIPTRTDSSSTTSSTSTGESSLLDRLKVTSSRTSLEDRDEESSKKGRSRAPGREKMVPVGDEFDGEDLNQGPPVTGHGYALWGRVTAVASNLTVNVSQAWQKSSRLADGEETPPGQESRLTKALKAYHLDRARSPTDLPVWLFDEHERGVAPKSWNAAKTGDFEDQFLPSNIHEPGQRGGLRDIYDQAAATSKPAGSGTRGTNGDAAPQEGSRATNRLKAIRDAKRTAIQTRSESEQLAMSARLRNENAGRESLPAAAARVGLPARPGRMKQ